MVRPMVHSTKHYVQFAIDQIVTATRQNVVLANSVESTVADASFEVAEGSSIKAIYVELWLQNQGTLGESIVTLTKDPVADTGPSFAEMATLFSYNNKKNILFTHQGLTSNDGVSGPVNVMRGWYKIPKSKQRFGLGDKINLNISNTSSNDLNRCGFAVYKEYT